MSNKMKANASLIFVTLSWGISFILAKNALSAFPVFEYLGLRFLIAFAITAVLFRGVWTRMTKEKLVKGIGLGIILFAGFGIQTLGLHYTTVAKSAFITGLSVVLVPLVLAIERRQKPELQTILSVVTASAGLALITFFGAGHGASGAEASALNIGDLLTLIGALFFALHIVGVEKVASTEAGSDPMSLAVLQIGTVGVLSTLLSVTMEKPVLPTDVFIWGQLIFLAIFCTAIAYVVQNVAQQHTSAEVTALIYALEPVFAALFSWILLGDMLTGIGMIGAGLILVGTLLNDLQLPLKKSLDESITE